MRKKITLAFSGGIDSSIAAVKLSRIGYEVHAVYLDLWKWKRKEDQDITKELDKKVEELSKIVPIKFSFVEANDIMRQVVVEDFQKQLGLGNTPNPCIRCNPLVKFHLILKYADEHDIEKIATGHYARIRENPDGTFDLMEGLDSSKDQSYMLCYLNQSILARTLFPLGETTKEENRRLAQELGLSVSNQAESQDLCFLNDQSYQDFVRHFSPEILIPGDILAKDGHILGRHEGLALYTIGQRKGIKIASKEAYYVIEKDITKNNLIVGYLSDLGKDQMLVEKVNWISVGDVEKRECDVKIRYRSKFYRGILTKQKNTDAYIVKFKEKLRDITPGQYAVFYENDTVLGGGMISKVL